MSEQTIATTQITARVPNDKLAVWRREAGKAGLPLARWVIAQVEARAGSKRASDGRAAPRARKVAAPKKAARKASRKAARRRSA